MADYVVLQVNPEQLKVSPTQPPSRTEAGGPLKQLMLSIKNVGLQYPPLVLALPNNEYQIIDGHRRIKATAEMGWQKVPVLVAKGNPGDLFAAVSGNVSKMKASEWITVHLRGGIVPSGPARTCILKLQERMGREYLERLEQKGMSPIIWNLSNRVLKYVGWDEDKRTKVLNWLINVKTRTVSAHIASGFKPDELRAAMEQQRELA